MKKFQLYGVEEDIFQNMLNGDPFSHDEWLLKIVKNYQEEVLKPATFNKVLDKWLYTQKENEYKPVMNYIDKGNHLFIIVFLKFPKHIDIKEDGISKTGGLDLVLPERQQYIPPRPGTAIIMNSNIYHTIYPFKGDGELLLMKALVKCEGWKDYE
jgi:hypothetical protein